MKPIIFSPDVSKKLQKLKSKDHILLQRIHKQLKVFDQDPLHPSLRLHKITGELENVWSISINRSMRMLYIEGEEDIYFFELGTHDEVYRK